MKRGIAVLVVLAAWLAACQAVLGDFSIGDGIALTLERSAFDFGSVPVGSTNASVSIRVSNNTAESASFAVSAEGEGFAAGRGDCADAPLAPGASCLVAASFRPTAKGAASGRLLLTGAGKASVDLSGTGIDAGTIAIDPPDADFGASAVGATSREMQFTATNKGGTPTGPLEVVITGSDAADFRIGASGERCTTNVLAPGESCVLNIVFTPQALGPKSASLNITGTPGGTGVASIGGSATTGAALTIEPRVLGFGVSRVGAIVGAPQQFIVSNASTTEASGVLDARLIGADASAFSISRDECGGRVLAPASQCKVFVIFTPASRGLKKAVLNVSADPGGNAAAALSGTGEGLVTLQTTMSGSGSGSISGMGITCGMDCSESFLSGETPPTVTLTATPAASSYVLKWSIAACGSSPTCDVVMSANQSVDVTFQLRPNTTITGAPPAATNRMQATFAFSSTDAAATFECSISGSTPTPCTSPYNIGFAAGMPVLSVTAISPTGIRDPTPATAGTRYVATSAMSPQPLVNIPFEDTVANTGAIATVVPALTGGSFVPGKFGKAIRFSGGTSNVALNGARDALWTTTSGKWTIGFWYKEDALQTNAGFFDIRNMSLGWQTYHGVAPPSYVTTCGPLCGSFLSPAAAVWHHMIFRYDGGYTTGAPIETYIDGTLLNTIANTADIFTSATPNGVIGNFITGGFGSLFYIDEFQIYDDVYTPTVMCQMIIRGTFSGATCTLP